MASNTPSPSTDLVLASSIPAPPRPLLYKPFNFLKSLSLNSVGLGIDTIPFTVGRELVYLQKETPAIQTGEKRKRIKIVAKRSRTRPQPRSQAPLSSKSSPPSCKSTRLAFQSSPCTSKPSAPFIQEISSSSTEGFSSSDSENTSFKQGRPVFFDILEEQAPQKSSKPTVKPSPAKSTVPRKPRTAPHQPLPALFLLPNAQNWLLPLLCLTCMRNCLSAMSSGGR